MFLVEHPISQLIRFARVSSHVYDFNTRNKLLTVKLLYQSYRYHKLRKAFSKFYRRHFDLVSKFEFNACLVMSIFSFSSCLGWAAACNCGTT